MCQSATGNVLDAFAPYAMINKSAVLIPMKLIPNNAPVVEFVKPVSVNVPGVFPAAHSEKAFVEMIITSDFVIPAENDLAHLGCLSGQFVDQSRTGFRVAESGLG